MGKYSCEKCAKSFSQNHTTTNTLVVKIRVKYKQTKSKR